MRSDRGQAPAVPKFRLFESGRRRVMAPSLSAVASVAAHGALVAGAILASTVAAHMAETSTRPPLFLFPELQKAPRPQQEKLDFIGLSGMAVTNATTDQPKPTVVDHAALPPEPPAEAQATEGTPQEPQRALSELEVDSTAARDPNSEGPVYPPELLAKNIEGASLLRFVVDAQGHVDVTSIGVIQATDSLFTKAARDALLKMRFRPAWFAGKPVAQLVEQEFKFRITRP